jgi:hypothetical protein
MTKSNPELEDLRRRVESLERAIGLNGDGSTCKIPKRLHVQELFVTDVDGNVRSRLGPTPGGGFGLSVFEPDFSDPRIEFGVTTPAPDKASPTPGMVVRGRDSQIAHLGIDRAGCPRFAIERHRFQKPPRIGKGGRPLAAPPPPPDRMPMELKGPPALDERPEDVDDDRWCDLELVRKAGEYRFSITNRQSDTVFSIVVNKAGEFSLEVGTPSRNKISGIKLSCQGDKAVASWGEHGASSGERVECSFIFDKVKGSMHPLMRIVKGEEVVQEIHSPDSPKPRPRKSK